MVPGCPSSGVTVTARILAVPEPQALLAATEIFPLLALAVAVMVAEEELPVHPAGRVQV
jgi:hypothetical protein